MRISNEGCLFHGMSDEDVFQPLTDEVLDEWMNHAGQFAEECEWLVTGDAPSCVDTLSLPIGIPITLDYRFKKTKGAMKLEAVTRLPDEAFILEENGLAGCPEDWDAGDVDAFIADAVNAAFPSSINIATFLKNLKKISRDQHTYLNPHLEDLSVRTESLLRLSFIMTFPAWTEASIEDDTETRCLNTVQVNELAGTEGMLRAEVLALLDATGGNDSMIDEGRDADGVLQGLSQAAEPLFYLYGQSVLYDDEEQYAVPTPFGRDSAIPRLFHLHSLLDGAELPEGQEVAFELSPIGFNMLAPYAGTYEAVHGCASLSHMTYAMDLAADSSMDALEYALSYENGFLEESNGMVCASESLILWRAATFVVNNMYGTAVDVRMRE